MEVVNKIDFVPTRLNTQLSPTIVGEIVWEYLTKTFGEEVTQEGSKQGINIFGNVVVGALDHIPFKVIDGSVWILNNVYNDGSWKKIDESKPGTGLKISATEGISIWQFTMPIFVPEMPVTPSAWIKVVELSGDTQDLAGFTKNVGMLFFNNVDLFLPSVKMPEDIDPLPLTRKGYLKVRVNENDYLMPLFQEGVDPIVPDGELPS